MSEPEPKSSGGGLPLDWKLPKLGCCFCTGALGGCPSKGALPMIGAFPVADCAGVTRPANDSVAHSR